MPDINSGVLNDDVPRSDNSDIAEEVIAVNEIQKDEKEAAEGK